MTVHAGAWNFAAKLNIHEFLAQVSRSLADYGPDGESIYVGESVGMLYRPLHSTSESRTEHQPYVSAIGKPFTGRGLDKSQGTDWPAQR